MRMRLYLSILLLVLSTTFAGPTPAPIKPQAIQFTQGNVTRTLAVPANAKSFTYSEALISGQRRFTLGGQWVQFPNSAVPVSSIWQFPVAECPPLPADAVRTMDCADTNPGTTGTWTQTHGWVQTPPLQGCVVSPLPWMPTVAPPDACTTTPPPPTLQAPLLKTQLVGFSKPARNVPVITQYGTTSWRVTDISDRPACEVIRNDYSRHRPENADGSYTLKYCLGGAWLLYDGHTDAFIKALDGVGGDSEIQWDPVDPKKFWCTDYNGGTVIYNYNVDTMVKSVYWDFDSQIPADWKPAEHCWTRAEGSPSIDNRYWALQCQHYNYPGDGSFSDKGYLVLDMQTKTVAKSWKTDSSWYDADHISMSPSGRSVIVGGGLANGHEMALYMDGRPDCDLNHSSEHSDVGVGPLDHDYIASVDFGTNGGDVFITDIDTCTGNYANDRHVITQMYNNPWFGTSYSSHISFKAFGRPGLLLFTNEGVNPTSVLLYSMQLQTWYGAGVSNSRIDNYWDEVHSVISRDGSTIWLNENYNSSMHGEVAKIQIPATLVALPVIRMPTTTAQPRLAPIHAPIRKTRPSLPKLHKPAPHA